MTTIVDLIAHVENEDQMEGLLDILIDDATFKDVDTIRRVLNDKVHSETATKAKNNYVKALELLR